VRSVWTGNSSAQQSKRANALAVSPAPLGKFFPSSIHVLTPENVVADEPSLGGQLGVEKLGIAEERLAAVVAIQINKVPWTRESGEDIFEGAYVHLRPDSKQAEVALGVLSKRRRAFYGVKLSLRSGKSYIQAPYTHVCAYLQYARRLSGLHQPIE
jgi:hypothetical protein